MRPSTNPYASLKRLTQNDHAETGIGTLIVFISMILVAAVAAGVLVRTSTNLQQQAEATGAEATGRVATGLEVVGVFGERDTVDTTLIKNVEMTLQLSAGSPALDLNELKVRWSDGATAVELDYAATAVAGTNYGVDVLRDSDGSAGTNPIINSNDLIKITVASVDLSPRTPVSVYLIPEGGLQTPILFTTPNTYTTEWITLA